VLAHDQQLSDTKRQRARLVHNLDFLSNDIFKFRNKVKVYGTVIVIIIGGGGTRECK
jgi:hypothetical protein